MTEAEAEILVDDLVRKVGRGMRSGAEADKGAAFDARNDLVRRLASPPREALREALERIRDYEPPFESLALGNEDCAECKRRMEAQWPPSGLCEEHYGKLEYNRDRNEAARNRSGIAMREIARAALASPPAPTTKEE